MLYESNVVNAVCDKLIKMGYVIDQKLDTTQKGFDIIVSKISDGKKIKLYIEAKGETSSRAKNGLHEKSNRFGEAFTSSQVREHIGQALYKVAQILSLNDSTCEIRAAIAIPKNKHHLDQVKKIQKGLNRLGVALFWVNDDLSVEIQSPLPL